MPPAMAESVSSRLCSGGAEGSSGMTGDFGDSGELEGSTYGAQDGRRRDERPAESARERSGWVGSP